MSSTYSINLNTVTMPAYSAIRKADDKFIGTEDYMGLAWYHAHHYRFICAMDCISEKKDT